MFKNAKVGDIVWCMRYGWGKIIGLYNADDDYPIEVEFGSTIQEFTVEGKYFSDDVLPILYWDNLDFNFPKQPARKITKWFYIFPGIKKGNFWAEGHSEKVMLFNSKEEIEYYLKDRNQEREIHIFSFETEE